MTGWTAIVPLKIGASSKSRLRDVLTVEARIDLIAVMARHVLAVLARIPQIDRIVVLSARRPGWWVGNWAEDHADSLNPALEAWREAERPDRLLVIHGDLPFVEPDEIVALLSAAQAAGTAMATDRAGLGTNALALAGSDEFAFRFGPNSREKHTESQPCVVLEIAGLARDIDEPADLAEFQRQGSRPDFVSQYSR